MFLVGFFSIWFSSQGNATLQLTSEPHLRGRVMSYWSIALTGSTFFGGPIIGWISQSFDQRWGLIVGGLAALIVGVYKIVEYKFTSHCCRR